MSKRKKKQSKLNKAVAHYFEGDPFDEGITRVDEPTLIALTQALGVEPDSYKKEHLVKLIRRLWSEAAIEIRQDIVAFFKSNGRIYVSRKPKEPNVDKEQKIEAILDELSEYNITKSEVFAIFNTFIDVRSKKITQAKVLATLKHLRLTHKRNSLESELGGIFDIYDCFLFNASFTFNYDGETFKKILVLKTPEFSNSYLQDTDEEELLVEINAIKKDIITLKQIEIDNFLSALPLQHQYLSRDDIIKSLKIAPPDVDISSITIAQNILTKILSPMIEIETITQDEHNLIVGISEYYSTKYSQKINYTLYVVVNAPRLYKEIWAEQSLTIFEEINEQKLVHEKHFHDTMEEMFELCKVEVSLLNMSDEEIIQIIYELVLPHLQGTLEISNKLYKKVLQKFSQRVSKALQKRQRHELLARTIRDFKNLFPQARSMKRQLILHVGPTNSGKTYEAMQELKQADTGYYLAPLRLLALEGYEELQSAGIEASLITGEEQIVSDEASHISSTIEMLSFENDVDVCVIDEVQLLDDRDRGWAWANAIIGAPASKVIMTGSENSRESIIALAEYLNEPLEIVQFKRKNPLKLLESATHIKDIKAKSAIVAFSRRDVLNVKQKIASMYSVSVIYGNLSPEVRREEARRFRDGETEVLVATDAIAMGLNLPIETILFYKSEKFDGERRRGLEATEIHQIAGRAGRFGMSEIGYVGALQPEVLRYIKKQYRAEDKKIEIPFKVKANLEHIKLVSSILEENSLVEILKFFVKNMTFAGPFKAANLDSMLEAAEILDKYNLDITTKYHFATAPLTTQSPYIMMSYERYVRSVEQNQAVLYIAPNIEGSYADSMDILLEAEDRVKEISLYLWLSYRFESYFIDVEKARKTRGILNKFIERSLQESHFVPRCRTCKKALPIDGKYAICQSCFRKEYRNPKRNNRNSK